jgi:hypothetical protein
MPSQEDIARQQALLSAHRETLHHYLMQRARLGSDYTPPGITHGINEAREYIRRIKKILRDWGGQVDNLPDDDHFEKLYNHKADEIMPRETDRLTNHSVKHNPYLQEARQIADIIKEHFPAKYRKELLALDVSEYTLSIQFTGHWNGKWSSGSDSTQAGGVSMRVYQVANALIGTAQLSNSIFGVGYLIGIIEDLEIAIEFFAREIPVVASIVGYVLEKGNNVAINGTYKIAAYDYGEFIVSKEILSPPKTV